MSRRTTFVSSLAVFVVLAAVAVVEFRSHPLGWFNAYTELRLRLTGAESYTATVEGIRVHYYAMGPSSGEPVVLVHGLGGRSEDWRNLAPFLKKAGYRVYMPDLPGYGQSEKPRDFSYSVVDEARIVEAFFDVLGLKQVDLGGWSMGGWVVQRVAADRPDEVRKLMLLDSAGLAVKPEWNTALFTPTSAAELAQLDALLMPNPPPVPQFVAKDILRNARQDAWIIHRALVSMLTGRDATDTLLPQLKMPVLIVWGQLDQIIPVSEGERMHALVAGSQLVIVPGCGHLAPVTCAGKIGPQLVAFLR